MKPFKLDVKHVLIKAREAFEAGTLQAEKNTGQGLCPKYVGPCAIGVAISREKARFLDKGGADNRAYGIDAQIESGIVLVENERDGEALSELQQAHDEWAGEGEIKQNKTAFNDLLTQLEIEYGVGHAAG